MSGAVVLGGGRLPTGELTQLSKERLDAAAHALERGDVGYITIMGGCHSLWRSHLLTFDISIAELEYQHLIRCGVQGADIYRIDEDVLDTISEAFVFWKHSTSTSSITVITTTTHLARATYLFQRIGGTKKRVASIGVPDSEGVLHEAEEAEYLEVAQRIFDIDDVVPIYDSWTQWRTSQADLYERFRAIRSKWVRMEVEGKV